MTPDQIKQARQALGLSQEKFAELIGVTRRAVVYWESGERVPSSTAVKLIERVTK